MFWAFLIVSLYRHFKRILKTLIYLLIIMCELKTNIIHPVIKSDLKLCHGDSLAK